MSEAIDTKYKKVANILNRVPGGFPYPISDTLLSILKHAIAEENLEFMMAFKKSISQSMDQLKESSGLTEEEILEKADALAKKGVLFNQPSSSGVMVFRLLPIGRQFEYTFMQELEKTEENMKISDLFAKLHEELDGLIQKNYDRFIKGMSKIPPIDRTVPIRTNKETGNELNIIVNKELEAPEQKIIPTQKVEELINKFDDIAVGHCYCRQHKEFLGDPCKHIELTPSCFTLGKSARHTSNHGFSKLVSKEEALKILKKIEDAGLVHKAYHLHSDISKDEVAICNCCSCCCLTARDCLIFPVSNATNYLASIDQDLCVGCGTCVEKCYNKAIELNDDNIAERIEEYCVGCGVCAYLCPENAISLIEGQRIVRMSPPRKN
ncbi:MAG: 4Fe-4S dicluster domain-containing protein [Promethearchaeota archaeon]|nr:MAG: 4Fe-4S dicluster domain-containing protein [Candidatus Lokiarchaeota archaeon]